MLVMATEEFACIRIIGRANCNSSVDFKTLVTGLCDKGCKCFVLDLTECVLMDSTFLGVLAGLGLRLSGGNGDPDQGGIELLNANARIIELLETLGVLHLFKLIEGSLAHSVPAEPLVPVPGNPTKAEVNRTCLEAHRTLIDLNPANAARFKEVTRYLAESLSKPGTE